jgi:pSer/pThr/pTyr-binding forkhead associated (FHA) protein/soluble lytic murein transglycosylase-like protein
MIRLKHLSGSFQGRIVEIAKPVLRIGRATDCDVRFEQNEDPNVSNHHAELLLEEGNWFVVDTASTNGTMINGRRVAKEKLSTGDTLQIGSGGPILQVHFDGILVEKPSFKTEAFRVEELAVHAPGFANTAQISAMSDQLKHDADTQTARLAELAARKVALERARAGGRSSGKTMAIMADTMREVQQSTKHVAKKRWLKVVAAVGGAAAVIVGAMSIVIVQQRRQIARLVETKTALDKEILQVEQAMASETDAARLEAMEQRLAQLTGNVQKAIDELGKADKSKAAEVVNGGDDLDRDIRNILAKFDAKTYAVPPLFKERLRFHVDELLHAGNLKYVYGRKQKYWPMILKEFGALGLPEEMAFIAWAETQFDPAARSKAGAAGMWQLGADTARHYNLRVDDEVDERFDATKSTRAAARYLANLLAEFGEDSFMLAMASYNRGESGMRRVLHEIASEPGGFKKERRDFWHLYRLRKLPEETREYVPKVLAAAIVSMNPHKHGLEPAGEKTN